MSFDFKKFANEIADELKGHCGGYTFVVSYNNDWKIKKQEGKARHPVDSPALDMSANVPFHTASVTKVITAAAMIKALDKAGISYGEPFYKYLPGHWKIHNDKKKISFRQILKHKSGLTSKGSGYSKVKQVMVNAIGPPPDKEYQNVNYALMRFLIPAVAGYKIPQLKSANSLLEKVQAAQYADAYMDYVQKEIFNKAGLPKLQCKTVPFMCGKAYHFPYLGHHGEDFGDQTLECASEGWVMTSAQLAKFFRQLNYTNNVLSESLGKTMRNSLAGYGDGGTTQKGIIYYGKRGWYPGKKNPGELRTFVMGFSNGVSVAGYINSEKKGGKEMVEILTDAHDNAYTVPDAKRFARKPR